MKVANKITHYEKLIKDSTELKPKKKIVCTCSDKKSGENICPVDAILNGFLGRMIS